MRRKHSKLDRVYVEASKETANLGILRELDEQVAIDSTVDLPSTPTFDGSVAGAVYGATGGKGCRALRAECEPIMSAVTPRRLSTAATDG